MGNTKYIVFSFNSFQDTRQKVHDYKISLLKMFFDNLYSIGGALRFLMLKSKLQLTSGSFMHLEY